MSRRCGHYCKWDCHVRTLECILAVLRQGSLLIALLQWGGYMLTAVSQHCSSRSGLIPNIISKVTMQVSYPNALA